MDSRLNVLEQDGVISLYFELKSNQGQALVELEQALLKKDSFKVGLLLNGINAEEEIPQKDMDRMCIRYDLINYKQEDESKEYVYLFMKNNVDE